MKKKTVKKQGSFKRKLEALLKQSDQVWVSLYKAAEGNSISARKYMLSVEYLVAIDNMVRELLEKK